MVDAYNYEHEQAVLDNLVEYYLSDVSVSGEILFGCFDDGSFGFSTWRFDDADKKVMKQSGFTSNILSILSDFMDVRRSCELEFTRDGIIKLRDSFISIKWLKTGSAEKIKKKWYELS